MVGLVYTFALIKALYDEGRDYLDSFWPFAVRVIPSKEFVTPSLIQKNLRERDSTWKCRFTYWR